MPIERYTVGRMFRSYLDTAARLGLKDEISNRVPELKALFDRPPLVTARIPGSVCDLLYREVHRMRGRDAIRSIGYDAMVREGRALVGSLVDNALNLYGRTPSAIFQSLPLIMMPLVGNTQVAWTPGEGGGALTIQPAGAVTPHAYAVWEGYLQYFLEAAGGTGTIDQAVLSPDQRSATIAVHW